MDVYFYICLKQVAAYLLCYAEKILDLGRACVSSQKPSYFVPIRMV